MGIMVGLVLGLIIAAGVAAYLYLTPSQFKSESGASKPAPAAIKPPAAASKPSEPPTVESATPPKSAAPDYTFYHILQGNTPDKQAATRPRELYWLQVAALSNPKEADRLKAKLTLLGMDVVVQKVDSGGAKLHRVRVGPFKTEDEAMTTLDTLVVNQFEPRLVKEAASN